MMRLPHIALLLPLASALIFSDDAPPAKRVAIIGSQYTLEYIYK